MGKITDVTLDKLRQFDTPTICNIIELFDVRPRNSGYMDSRIKACFPDLPPMVGFAATATFRTDAPPISGEAYESLPAQVERFSELSGPAVVVFQDLDVPTAAATFGEVMCTAYQVFGAVGLITSGAGRDLDQVRDIDFPAFTDGTICAHGYCHIPQIHTQVQVGGIAISPDDLLHGDCNGVTIIPKEIAVDIADVGDEFVSAEEVTLGALRDNPTVEKFAAARSEANEIVMRLRERVR